MAYTLFTSYEDENGKPYIFDVSQLAHDIRLTTSLESQARRLTFQLERDPYDKFKIAIGSQVQFFSSTRCLFFGKVFTIETDLSDVYMVVAYDKMRYLKNEDAVLVDSTYKLDTLFNNIMEKYSLAHEVSNWTKQVTLSNLEEHHFWNKSLFDILDYYMRLEEIRLNIPYDIASQISESNIIKRRFYLKCDVNRIQLREVYYDFLYEEDGTPKTKFLLIGDNSLLTNYRYKVDIDNNVYNRFIFVANEENQNSAQSDDTNTQVNEKQLVAAIDAGYRISNTDTSLDNTKIGENTLMTWGILSTIITLDNAEEKNKLSVYMKSVVESMSQANKTLKLNAIGNDDIAAGSAFFLYLSKLGMSFPVYVLSATHVFDEGEHTMELDVCTNANMRNFL